jgi:hypothetical protein
MENFYIPFRTTSCFKEKYTKTQMTKYCYSPLLTGKRPGQAIHVGTSIDAL